MKVLLSDTWSGGGASTFVAVMARGLRRRGHVVDVVLGYRDSPAVDAYRDCVRRVFTPPSSFTRTALQGDYDVVHVTEGDLGPPFDYARRTKRLGVRAQVVVTVHTERPHLPADADVVVYVSEAARRAAGGSEGTVVIPNGVDAEHLLASADALLVADDGGPTALWVGRVDETVPQKDFTGFAAAIETLLRQGWSVVVVDGAPVRPDYPAQEQVRRWFGSSVTYANQVGAATVAGALLRTGRSGGALVSTSRTEAAPFVALEALALGCPVVAPAIPGFRPLLSAGRATGYTSLASLLQVLDERSFQSAVTELPADLPAETMVDRYLELYARAGAPVDRRPRTRAVRAAAAVATRPEVERLRMRVGRHRD